MTPQAKPVTVSVRRIYGLPVIYPACEASRLFADIAGTKTLTRAAVAKIKDLGYAVTVKQDEPQTI